MARREGVHRRSFSPGRTSLAALCAALLLAQSVSAAVQQVTDTADPGTLRTAVGAAVSGDVIQWQAGSGGTITLGSDLTPVAGGVTLDVSGAPAPSGIAGPGAVPLGGAVTLFNNNLAQPFTISAPIKGAGSLTESGGGELDLLGANTFTGGLFMSSGTLVVNSDASFGDGAALFEVNGVSTVSFTGVITSTRSWQLNASIYVNDNGNNSTLFGSIGGGGILNKSGAGLMELGGSNSFTGGTVLNAGTLRIDQSAGIGSGPLTFNGGAFQFSGTSLTLSVPITLNTNSATFDTMGNEATIEGAISGAGGLVMTSTGTLILTAANSYLSSTTVSGGGTLQITSDANLGAAGTTLTLSNGSTLKLGSLGEGVAYSSNRPLVLGAGGGAIDTSGQPTVLSGLISGAGGLTFTGGGMLTLGNPAVANTYTGSTTINAGILAMAGNSALGNGGDLGVASGALLDMGAFTQTIGNFNGGGAVKMLLATGVTNLAVNHTATFTGTTLTVGLPVQAAKPAASYVYTPISYAGHAGTFASIVSPAAIAFTPTYGAGGLTLTGTFVPLNTLAANSNQAGVGAALEPFRAAPSGDMANVLGSLYSLDANGLQSALDQIGPVSLGAIGGLGLAQAGAQSEAVQRRMNALARAGGESSDESTVQRYTVTGKSLYPGPLYAEAPGDDQPVETQGSRSRWGYFTSGVVTTGRVQDASGPSGSQPGYAFNTDGLTAGGDYRVNDHLAAGMALGYLHGHASILAPASGTMANNSGRLGGYATAFGESFAANLYVGGAVDAFTTNRGISLPGVARTANGTPHGRELNVHPSASYDVKTRDYGTFSPYAAFDYDELWVGSFQETGADSLDLSVDAQRQVTEQSGLGLRYSQRLTDGTHVFTPYASAGWRHAFNDQSRPITSSLAGSAPFTVMTGRIARDGALAGLGVDVAWTPDLTARLDYSGDYRSHYQDNNVSLTARFRF